MRYLLMDIYAGKTALIAGASGGIGEVFAQELATLGMHVILVARSEEALRKVAAELTRQYGVRSEVIVADLSQEKTSAQIQAVVAQRGLCIDLLVNNAGFATYDAFEKIDPGQRQALSHVWSARGRAFPYWPAPGSD